MVQKKYKKNAVAAVQYVPGLELSSAQALKCGFFCGHVGCCCASTQNFFRTYRKPQNKCPYSIMQGCHAVITPIYPRTGFHKINVRFSQNKCFFFQKMWTGHLFCEHRYRDMMPGAIDYGVGRVHLSWPLPKWSD